MIRPGVPAFRLAYVSPAVTPYPEILAMTDIFSVPDELLNTPLQIRTSLVTDNVRSMRVMWAQPENSIPGTVFVGTSPGNYSNIFPVSNVFTFNATDLCEQEQMPASSVGFENPGLQIESIITGLEFNTTYYFQIVATNLKSLERNFVTGPAPGGRTKMIVFGDMGSSMFDTDGSSQHSWDFKGEGEISAPNTSKLVEHLVLAHDATVVNHIGDLSYATGSLSIWDTWLTQIEPVASHVPYMTGIGNHEMGWSKSAIPGTDSLGECGVPYISYFPFSSHLYSTLKPSNKVRHFDGWKAPYYSYTHGNVHVVVMSTEHQYDPSSVQYAWIKQDLANVDRSSTHWIMFLGHRPMYVSSSWSGDHDAAAFSLQEHIEPLLIQYRVDVALWGHHHSYQRTCRHLANNSCTSGYGVQHFVVGSAGFDFSKVADTMPDQFEFVTNKTWGVLMLDFQNATSLFVQFFDNSHAKVLDQAWVHRNLDAESFSAIM